MIVGCCSSVYCLLKSEWWTDHVWYAKWNWNTNETTWYTNRLTFARCWSPGATICTIPSQYVLVTQSSGNGLPPVLEQTKTTSNLKQVELMWWQVRQFQIYIPANITSITRLNFSNRTHPIFLFQCRLIWHPGIGKATWAI